MSRYYLCKEIEEARPVDAPENYRVKDARTNQPVSGAMPYAEARIVLRKKEEEADLETEDAPLSMSFGSWRI